jgi:hypothetical protein
LSFRRQQGICFFPCHCLFLPLFRSTAKGKIIVGNSHCPP